MPAFVSKYKIIEKIGEGSFSEVLKCENRITKEQHAAKILKKSFQREKDRQEEFKGVRQCNNDVYYCAEIIAMQKLTKHVNILYMLEYFFEKRSGKLIFIFELMDMSIYEFMKLKSRCIPELKVKIYLYQILSGIDYLHRNGLFHRDIKPENILIKLHPTISYMNYQSERVKIADLGSIRGIYSKPPYTEYISTRWYRSPECLLTAGHYGPKMDIWATGCVFYEILTKKPLFPGTNEIDQLNRIHAVLGTPSTRLLSKLKSRSKNVKNFQRQIGTGLTPLIAIFSNDAQIILKLMLLYDPDIRSNTRRLLQHRYFNSLKESVEVKKTHIAREFGDSTINTANTNYELYNNKKFYSNSLKTLYNANIYDSKSLYSKTAVELGRVKTKRVGSKGSNTKKTVRANSDPQNRATKVRPKNSTQQNSVPQNSVLPNSIPQFNNMKSNKVPMSNNNNTMFRHTTSNLVKKIGSLEQGKIKNFQSNSFVSPRILNRRESKTRIR